MIRHGHSQVSSQFTTLTSSQQFDDIHQKSMIEDVYLLKHSTRCGISHAALDQVETFLAGQADVTFYYLDLLAHRDISNQIADRYGVPHQSPQVLVVSKGKVVRHTSHHAIDVDWLSGK